MSKRSRRSITIVITDTWTIRWGDTTMIPTATTTPQSQQTHFMNKENLMTAFENATKFLLIVKRRKAGPAVNPTWLRAPPSPPKASRWLKSKPCKPIVIGCMA